VERIIARQGSLSEVAEINRHIPEFKDYNETYFAQRIEGRKSIILIGEHKGRHAGYLVSYDKYLDGSFYCWMAAVIPEFRRKGVLSSMISHLEEWCRENGYGCLRLKTRNCRRGMLAFLVKKGFLFTDVDLREDIMQNRVLTEKVV
jgi:ribosomal protein S18 acetylase RimI-like enzyme